MGGGKGFHVIDFDYDIKKHMESHLPKSRVLLEAWEKSYDLNERMKFDNVLMTPSGVRQNISRNWKKGIIGLMKRDGLLVDFEVTPDPRRIIRVPGTVHGKKLNVCEVISQDDIFKPAKTI